MRVNTRESGLPASHSGRRLALLIGTSGYRDPFLATLYSPALDVQALAEVLGDPDIGNFEVETLLNRPHTEVRRSLRELCRGLADKDTVIVYFSGHGLREPDGELCLAMTDTEREGRSDTSLTNHDLDRALSNSGAGQKVVILDCCYSGAYSTAKSTTGLTLSEHFPDRGYCVLASSTAVQRSSDGAGSEALSVFTK